MILPRGMTVEDWTAAMTVTLVQYGPVPVLRTPEDWQEWAVVVNTLPTINAADPPDPYQFELWTDWAEAFAQIETFQE